jgi:hypothetical protein
VNLAADPGHKSMRAELSAALDRWTHEHDDTAFHSQRPTARDGSPLA